MGSIPGWGRSPGGGHGNPLQYSYLDRGAWPATVPGVKKSQTEVTSHAYLKMGKNSSHISPLGG